MTIRSRRLKLYRPIPESNGGAIIPPSVQITGHQLGGAVMAKFAIRMVVCLVRKDSMLLTELFPGSGTCMNPALTIVLRERALDTIIKENIRARRNYSHHSFPQFVCPQPPSRCRRMV